MEAVVDIRPSCDTRARAGCRQRHAQVKRGKGPLALPQLHCFATGVEQCVSTHPLALVRHDAQLSVIHLGLLSLPPQQPTQERFRMDRNKNLQENQLLKSAYP
jgi:hypothetical protein